MVRIGKKQERRNISPRKHRFPSPKTGTLKDNLPLGYKPHENAVNDDLSKTTFIPKIK